MGLCPIRKGHLLVSPGLLKVAVPPFLLLAVPLALPLALPVPLPVLLAVPLLLPVAVILGRRWDVIADVVEYAAG